MSRIQPNKVYTREFKFEAVRMLKESDRTSTEISRSLGISRSMLYKWKDLFEAKGNQAFKNKPGRPKKADQSELTILKQENDRLREEVDILKKAAAYFARELK